jgi:hypothetical protein
MPFPKVSTLAATAALATSSQNNNRYTHSYFILYYKSSLITIVLHITLSYLRDNAQTLDDKLKTYGNFAKRIKSNR